MNWIVGVGKQIESDVLRGNVRFVTDRIELQGVRGKRPGKVGNGVTRMRMSGQAGKYYTVCEKVTEHILAHDDGIRSKAKRMYTLLVNKEGDNFVKVATE